ncbi:MAG: hypothetical protein R3A10_17940 [Caldilineaceae bacterium]
MLLCMPAPPLLWLAAVGDDARRRAHDVAPPCPSPGRGPARHRRCDRPSGSRW